jgi:hypothetical protein
MRGLRQRKRSETDADDADGSRREHPHVVISLNDESGRFDARIGVVPRCQRGCRDSPCGDRRAAGDSVQYWATRAEPRRAGHPFAVGFVRRASSGGLGTDECHRSVSRQCRARRFPCQAAPLAPVPLVDHAHRCDRPARLVLAAHEGPDCHAHDFSSGPQVSRMRTGVSATAGRSSAGDAPRSGAAAPTGASSHRQNSRGWAGRTV